MKRKLALIIIFLFVLISLFYGEYYFYNKKIAKDHIIIAKRDLNKGMQIHEKDLLIKETINFDNPIYLNNQEEIIGSYAKKDIEKDSVIKTNDISTKVVQSVYDLKNKNNVFISLKFKNVDSVCWNFKVDDVVDLYFASKHKPYQSTIFKALRVVKILDSNLHLVHDEMSQAEYVIFEVSEQEAKDILDLKSEGHLSIISY